MFKLTSEPTFRHKVRAHVPIDGGHRDETFEVTYRVLATDKVRDFDLATGEGTTEFLKAIIAELHDIADGSGKPLPWSDEVRDAVLRLPYARTAISNGYFEAISGARKGN